MNNPLHSICSSRRQFMCRLAGLAAAATLGETLSGCGVEPDSVALPTPGQATISLNDPAYAALQPVGGQLKYRWSNGAPVIVRHSAIDVYQAYSASCTHEGCEVPLPSNGAIECPCHGARYNAGGIRQSGPGSGNLRAGTTALAGSDLTITF